MYSVEDLAKAIIRSLEERCFPNEVAVSELFIPGEPERHLRVSVYDAEDEQVDQLESDLFDLIFAFEKKGYPGRALVSVYRREVSPATRRLPPEPLQVYVPRSEVRASDMHGELFKRLLRQPLEVVAVPQYFKQASVCRHRVPPQLWKLSTKTKDFELESPAGQACHSSDGSQESRRPGFLLGLAAMKPGLRAGSPAWKERDDYQGQGRAA